MQRSSSKWQQAKGHGERDQIAVSTHGTRVCAVAPDPTASSEAELMRRIAIRFRSGLSEASPKGTLVCPQCDPEKNSMPKPTHPWHQVHNDEREDDFGMRDATILVR